jgi:5-hydroxyisourate hydrolase
MMRISTHVLDLTRGRPAHDVPVRLDRQEKNGDWRMLSSARTDQDGRCAQLLDANETLTPGIYRLSFDTETYFRAVMFEGLYPAVEITFLVRNGEEQFHIPLLLSPNGYTTYRGS